MSDKFFVHVGTRKSGTSFVQRVIGNSRPELRELGVGFPFGVYSKVRDRLFAPLHLPVGTDQDVTEVNRKLARIVERNPSAIGVASLEGLASLRGPRVEGFLQGLDRAEGHVIITARDLARQIPSEWQQAAKSERVADLATYCRMATDPTGRIGDMFDRRHNVPAIAAAWGAGLPPERVHIMVHSQSSEDKDWLPRNFFALLGVDYQELPKPEKLINASLSYEEAELLRRVFFKSNVVADEAPVNLIAPAKRLMGQSLQERSAPIRISPEILPWCIEESRRQVEAIRAAGWHVIGDLDDLLVREDTECLAPGSDSEKLLELAVGRLARLFDEDVEARAKSVAVPTSASPSRKALRRVRRAVQDKRS
jgi:hypothetical protein